MIIKTVAIMVGTAIVLWFITAVTPSDDRTPSQQQRLNYQCSDAESCRGHCQPC